MSFLLERTAIVTNYSYSGLGFGGHFFKYERSEPFISRKQVTVFVANDKFKLSSENK